MTTANVNGLGAPSEDLAAPAWLAAPEAERGVIAALLASSEVQDEYLRALTGAHFVHGLYRAVFKAISDLRRDGRPADIVTVPDRLRGQLGEDDLRRVEDLLLSDFLSDNELASAVGVLQDRRTKGDLKRLVERAAGQLGANEARDTLAALQAGIDQIGRAANWQPVTRKTIWTTPELLSTEFPEPRWAVPGLVPVGLSFLAGRPKMGKSWLALQFAIAIGSGGKVFDEDVEARKVLYLALEDSERRIKDRAQKQGIPGHTAVTWATEWATMDAGGGDAVMNAVQAGGFGLVIVDTLSRFIGSGDQQNLSAMTMLLGGLQRLAMAADVAVLIVDHHRKIGALGADVIDDLLGSTGKAAVADAVLGLYKVQGRKGAQLAITGRDVEERTLALEWDALTCCWQCLGDAGDVQKDTVQGAILAGIAELVQLGQLPTSTTIAEHLSQKKQNVNRALLALVTGGQVIRGPKQGREQPYYLPAQIADLNAQEE